jgi:hypothetical protein
MRFDVICDGCRHDATALQAQRTQRLEPELMTAPAFPAHGTVPTMNFRTVRHRGSLRIARTMQATAFARRMKRWTMSSGPLVIRTGRKPMKSDRELEQLFSSLHFMLRKAHNNPWPRSPQARDEMRDHLEAALEPVFQAFALTDPVLSAPSECAAIQCAAERKHPKRRRAA